MNILTLLLNDLPNPNVGGPHRIAYELLRHALTLSHEYDTAFLSAKYYLSPKDLRELIEREKMRAHAHRKIHTVRHFLASLANRSRFGLHAQARYDRMRLRKKIRSIALQPDIIHSHQLLASAHIPPGSAAKILTTIHSKGTILFDTYRQSYPFIHSTMFEKYLMKLERDGIAKSDCIIFPSHAAKKLFESDLPHALDNKRVEIIYNGIDVDALRTVKKNPCNSKSGVWRLLNVSAFVDEKRFDLTLETLQILLRRNQPVKLIHIGDGPRRQDSLDMIRSKGLEQHVEHYDALPHKQVMAIMQECDVFILPSTRVVCDLVTLEAMAVGLPCVVSADGGNLELIHDGVDGMLCTSGDSHGYALAIEQLIANDDFRVTIAACAQKKIREKFTVERMYEQYISMYREMYP